MCIIVDTCVFACVFNAGAARHEDFHPVHDWIYHGRGRLVYGGTKYKRELPPKYYGTLIELDKMRRTIPLDDGEVDKWQDQVVKAVNARRFDDPHLVAIVIVSRSRLVCTDDTRAMKYLHMKKLYPDKMKAPKIYSRKSNADLLVDENIPDSYR